MKWLGSTNLTVRLLLIVMIALVPTMVLVIWVAVDEQRLAAREAEDQALRFSRMGIAELDRVAEGTRQLLVTLAQLPEVNSGDSAVCSALMARLRSQYQWYANLGAIAQDGQTFCSGYPMTGPVNSSQRTWFQQATGKRDFAIGDFQISQVTQRPTLNFAYPMVDSDRELKGVVFAAMELGWLNHLVAQTQIPKGCTVTVVDRNGTVLARYPDPKPWVGKDASEVALVKEMLTKREGTTEAAGLDGVPRLYGFTALSGPPSGGNLHLSVGIPAEVAFARFRNDLYRNLLGLGVVIAIALTVGWLGGQILLGRQLKVLLGTARRLAVADYSARTGLPRGKGEINQLAEVLDDLAQTAGIMSGTAGTDGSGERKAP